MPDPLLDAEAIRDLLAEVADELEAIAEPGSERPEVVVVGGAMLALRGLRRATHDVDSVRPVPVTLAAAVANVADRHGLAPRWLNDRARGFLPLTFDVSECDVFLDRPALLVLGAPFDQVFLMKVKAGRAVDSDDLEALWPHCSFASPEAAAEAFVAAYPLESHDPYLAEWIASVT